MAGVAGKSGGKRAGAGRKPGPKAPKLPDAPPVLNKEEEPLGFLLGVMQGRLECSATQLRAAIAAAQYVHTKRADGGKKDEIAEKASKVASGRFAATAPPKLVHSR